MGGGRHARLARPVPLSSAHGTETSVLACNRVAGVVITRSEDGTHHVISEISGGLARPHGRDGRPRI